MDRPDEDETRLVARFIDARVWARYEAGIPEGVARSADVVSRPVPNTTMSLHYLRSRYPGVYGPEANWLDFLRTGVPLLHVPGDAFQRHMDVQAAVGLLVGLRPGSALHPYVKEAAANPIYAATLAAAFNEADGGLVFSPRLYYRLNPDVLDAAAPAHIHFLLTGCFEQRAVSPDIRMRDYADARTVELDRRIEELRVKLQWRSVPQSPLLCALAHVRLDDSVPELFERYTGRRLPYSVRRRGLRSDDRSAARPKLTTGTTLTRAEQEIAKIRGRGLLDRAFYLRNNPDVASANLDPVHHYVTVGEAQGRLPRVGFDPLAYLSLHWEARRKGGSALVHASEVHRLPGSAPCPAERAPDGCILLVGGNGRAGGWRAPLPSLAAWTCRHSRRRVVAVLLGQGELGDTLAGYGPTLVLPDPTEEADWLRRFLASRRVAVVHGYGHAAADFLRQADADLFRTAKIVLHVGGEAGLDTKPPVRADRWVCHSVAAYEHLTGGPGSDPAQACLLPAMTEQGDEAALLQLEAFLWDGITRPSVTVIVPEAVATPRFLQGLLHQDLRSIQIIWFGDPGDAPTRDPRIECVPLRAGDAGSPGGYARAMARARAPAVWLAGREEDADDPAFLGGLVASDGATLVRRDVVDEAGRVLGSLFSAARP